MKWSQVYHVRGRLTGVDEESEEEGWMEGSSERMKISEDRVKTGTKGDVGAGGARVHRGIDRCNGAEGDPVGARVEVAGRKERV